MFLFLPRLHLQYCSSDHIGMIGRMEKSAEILAVKDNRAGLFSLKAELMYAYEVLRELAQERIPELRVSEVEFAKRCFLGLKVFLHGCYSRPNT